MMSCLSLSGHLSLSTNNLQNPDKGKISKRFVTTMKTASHCEQYIKGTVDRGLRQAMVDRAA